MEDGIERTKVAGGREPPLADGGSETLILRGRMAFSDRQAQRRLMINADFAWARPSFGDDLIDALTSTEPPEDRATVNLLV